jgi:hypothetical protein
MHLPSRKYVSLTPGIFYDGLKMANLKSDKAGKLMLTKYFFTDDLLSECKTFIFQYH